MNFGMTILSLNMVIKYNWVSDTDSFIVHIQTEDFYKDIANDVNKWFDTSGYSKNDDRPLPLGINKKVLGMFKD